MKLGFGFKSSNRTAGFSKSHIDAPAELQFAKCTACIYNMSSGRIAAKNMVFDANCSWSVKYYNNSTQAQIGTTKTGTYSGTPSSAASVVVSDGTEVRATYTCTTTAPGYKAVTQETVLWVVVMADGTGDSTTLTPDNPVG